jgi:DNA-binding GntR family transcriptional regulator
VPGQRLSEPDMMREFHVSRGSVREALRCLEADGLVQIEFYRGARIRKMSRNEFIEANQIRALLEGFAAALAAQRMDGTDRKKLLELEQNWDRGNKGWSYAEYNEKFHDLILQASHHKQLPTYVEQVQPLIFDLQFHRIQRTPAATRRSRLEHRRVVKAILKGDAKGAERAMRQHIDSSGASILAAPEEFFSA